MGCIHVSPWVNTHALDVRPEAAQLDVLWWRRGGTIGAGHSRVGDSSCAVWRLPWCPYAIWIAQFFAIGHSVAIGILFANPWHPNSWTRLPEIASELIASSCSCSKQVTDTRNNSTIAISHIVTIWNFPSETLVGMSAPHNDGKRHRSVDGN